MVPILWFLDVVGKQFKKLVYQMFLVPHSTVLFKYHFQLVHSISIYGYQEKVFLEKCCKLMCKSNLISEGK